MKTEIQIKEEINKGTFYSMINRLSLSIGVLDCGIDYLCDIIIEDIYQDEIKIYRIEKHVGIGSNYFTKEITDFRTGNCIEYYRSL